MAFSWGRETFDSLFSDPFFRGFPEEATRMPSFDWFDRQFALPPARKSRGEGRRDEKRNREIERHDDRLFDPFLSFRRMNEMMKTSIADDPNSYSFSSSTFQSFSKNGDTAPKIYEASSSTRRAPGGIKETRKSIRDSEQGLEKVHVGHHINDRAHVMERSVNRKTGHRKEKQNFLNMEESEGSQFADEWEKKTKDHNKAMSKKWLPAGRTSGALDSPKGRRGQPRGLPAGSGRSHREQERSVGRHEDRGKRRERLSEY